MTFFSSILFYINDGDHMKKIIPYILSLLLGIMCAFLLFKNDNILASFNETITVKAFQLGVYNEEKLAKEMKDKYPPSIIIKDDDVYRVYYSMLTKESTISKMEDYLNREKIAFYIKDVTISDENLINFLTKYESSMTEGNDDVLISINKLIMNSYGG